MPTPHAHRSLLSLCAAALLAPLAARADDGPGAPPPPRPAPAAEAPPPRPPPGPPGREVGPGRRGPPPIAVEDGVVYGRAGEVDLLLDVFPCPARYEGARPAIVWIHGGGWTRGDRGAMRDVAVDLALEGFVGFSVDYRLAPDHPFPAAIEDVKAAIRFVRGNASRWRVDPDRIAVAGTSAGGHLALLAGLADAAAGLEGTGGHPGVSSRVQAVVSGFGPTDFTKDGRGGVEAFLRGRAREASPLAYVSPDDPPVLLLHGTADEVVPVAHSEWMAAALAAAQVPVTFVRAKDAPHGYWNRPAWRFPVRWAIKGFLERRMPAGPAPTRPPTTPAPMEPEAPPGR